MNTTPEHSELGKSSAFDTHYNPDRLFAIPRTDKRRELNIDPARPPFYGFDCWNHYEVSWLNDKGKPVVAIAEITYDCATPNIVESKSLKLYFNSLNNTRFRDSDAVRDVVVHDLATRVGGDVHARILPLRAREFNTILPGFTGESIDELDVACDTSQVTPGFLETESGPTTEVLCSDLLKSNCLVTGQPDWGSVQIAYTGPKIHREGLLKYLVSFRNHHEFHEQCIERIFVDILRHCHPDALTVYGRYTRRGGLDINPLRSTSPITPEGMNLRLVRQ